MNNVRCSRCGNAIESSPEKPMRIDRSKDGIWESFCHDCELKYLGPVEPIDPSRVVWQGVVHEDGTVESQDVAHSNE